MLSGDIDGSVNSYRLVQIKNDYLDADVMFDRFEFRSANAHPIASSGAFLGAAIDAEGQHIPGDLGGDVYEFAPLSWTG